ncbi:MAG: TetR/AcrR family transcriptional regulator [Cyanobacteria bacterium J06641_2]
MSGETNQQSQRNSSQFYEKILIAAAELFYFKGFSQVTINEVIAKSKVSRRTFYRYFPSKNELILEVMRFQAKRWLKYFEEEVSKRASSPREMILSSLDVLREWYESPQFHGCPFIKAALEVADISHPVNQIVVTARQSVRTYIFKLALEANIPQPEIFSHQYLLLMGGSILMASIEGNTMGVEYARETLMAFMDGS